MWYSWIIEHNFLPIVLGRNSCAVFTGSDASSLKQELLIYLVQFIHSEVRVYIIVLQCEQTETGLICFSNGEVITVGQYTSAMDALTSYWKNLLRNENLRLVDLMSLKPIYYFCRKTQAPSSCIWCSAMWWLVNAMTIA